jgi:GTP-binding protein Era
VLTTDDCQIIIVDTPGLHRPKHALGEFMMKEAEGALGSVDAICFVVEAGHPLGPAGESILSLITGAKAPILLVANKTDLCRGKEGEERFWRHIEPIRERLSAAAVIPVSAKEGTNLDVLVEEITKLLPAGPAIYPEDVLMDATERFLAEEIIREKIFEVTEQEVPHSVAVTVEEFKSPDEYPEMKRGEIRADIIVERPGQKAILIGDKGSRLKAVGTAARLEMEGRFGYPIFLQLWVRVRPDWRKTALGIERVGYRRR